MEVIIKPARRKILVKPVRQQSEIVVESDLPNAGEVISTGKEVPENIITGSHVYFSKHSGWKFGKFTILKTDEILYSETPL